MWGMQKWNQKRAIQDAYLEQAREDTANLTESAQENTKTAEVQLEDEQEISAANDNGEDATEEALAVEETYDEEGEETLPEIMTDEKGEVTLVFGGDICFHDPYANMGAFRERGSNIEKCISSYLLKEMRDADICMVNNEFPYSNRGNSLEGKMYTFRSKPENVNILHDMGVDIVAIANNHAYDYGREAFEDTIQTLDDAKILHVGGGRNLEDASKPVFVTINNVKIGYLAVTQIERNDSPDTKGATEETPGVLRCYNQRELDHFLALVEQTKKECDYLVVYIHWGTENTDQPDWAQPHQADLISAAGADIIVGCHPHCLQGLTLMNEVPVIYSLGNYWFNSKTVDTALLKLKVNGDGLQSMQMIAARQAGCATQELEGDEKQRVLSYLQSLSPNMSFDSEGYVTW